MILVGNDVSHWQNDINWDVYKDNSNFCIIKSTEGSGYIDPKFRRNQSEARRVDLPRGYYHFARADINNTPQAEANFFINSLGPLQDGELLALDFEVNWSGNVPDWCHIFLDRVFTLTDCRPLIYLNQSLITKYNWQNVVNDGYGLWVAAYTYDPMKNYFKKGPWPFAAMQQWTNKQPVPGVSGLIDGDVFFGGVVTFKKYGYQKPIIPTVLPTPPETNPENPPAMPPTEPIPPVIEPTPPVMPSTPPVAHPNIWSAFLSWLAKILRMRVW